jgi:hypothetical protein
MSVSRHGVVAVLSSGMSEAQWFYDKAAECARLAAVASDTGIRAERLREQKHWTEIAKSIEHGEAARKLQGVD